MIRTPHDVEARDLAGTRTGAPDLPAPRTPTGPHRRSHRGATPALVVDRGPAQGTEFRLTAGTTVLGRHRDCDIVLTDVTVSRYHTEIQREGDRYFVCDAGSLNGTYLNRQVVDRAELADGDEIWVGKARFRFVR